MTKQQRQSQTSWFAIVAAVLYFLVAIGPIVALFLLVLRGTQPPRFVIATAIVAHVPAAYGILRGRLWLFIAMPLGWCLAIAAMMWFAKQINAPPRTGGPYPIGNLDEILLVWAIFLVAGGLGLLLVISIALACWLGPYGKGDQRWLVTRRELAVAVLLVGVAIGFDFATAAWIKAVRAQRRAEDQSSQLLVFNRPNEATPLAASRYGVDVSIAPTVLHAK